MKNKYKIEAVLFASGEKLSLEDLSKICEINNEEVQEAITELIHEYQEEDRGLTILEKESSGKRMVQLVTNEKASNFVKKLNKLVLEGDLTPTALEVLSIVAYRGPISHRGIEEIRGANSSYPLKTLLIRGLIDRYPHPQRRNTYLYEISFNLLKFLGLTKISELPEYEKLKNSQLQASENTQNIDQEGDKEIY